MSDILDIEQETVPSWYDLRVTRRGLAVDLHPQAFQHVVAIFGTGYFASQKHTVYSDGEKKDYPLPPFINPSGPAQAWGFGGNAKPLPPSRSGWVSFVVTLPQGQEPLDLAKWYQPSATLNAIFRAVRFPEFRTDFSKPQLVVISGLMTDARNVYAGAIEAAISPAMRRWLSQKPEGTKLPAAAQAMYQTWRRIEKERPEHPGWFRQEFDTSINGVGLLHLTVPGNACGLDPEVGGFTGKDEGYTLVPHNTDGVVQQWALLAGLAKVGELARADGF